MAYFRVAFYALFVVLKGDSFVWVISLAIHHKAENLSRCFLCPPERDLRNIGGKLSERVYNQI